MNRAGGTVRHAPRRCSPPQPSSEADSVERAADDGADEGERQIGRDKAQCADEVHHSVPLFDVVDRVNDESSKAFRRQKVRGAVVPGASAWLSVRKINPLKSL